MPAARTAVKACGVVPLRFGKPKWGLPNWLRMRRDPEAVPMRKGGRRRAQTMQEVRDVAATDEGRHQVQGKTDATMLGVQHGQHCDRPPRTVCAMLCGDA